MALEAGIMWALALAGLFSCATEPSTSVVSDTENTIVFGGDLFLARGVNEALLDEAKRPGILGGVAPLLRAADVAVVNAEGVVSAGGRYFDKGEPRPFAHRAHPVAIEVLSDAGIDAVTVGNNHAMDYGPAAMVEMLDRLAQADIGYTGGGVNPHDAAQPYYQRVGDTVVAVVGVDLSGTRNFGVRPRRPGTLLFRPEAHDAMVRDLGAIATKARQHAHVVILTPHWGKNGETAPTDETRALAKRLLGEGGFDAIVGHSAHVMQGAEVFDGEPVIYDAGNLVVDVGGRKAGMAMLWELAFDRRGVVAARGHPLQLRRNQALRPTDPGPVLTAFQERSEVLGTSVSIVDGVATLACDPGDAHGPDGVKDPPRRAVPKSVRLAHDFSRADALPDAAVPMDVSWGPVRLRGYELVADGLLPPKAAQVVVLYLERTGPVSDDLRIGLQAVSAAGRRNEARHIPGDWQRPVSTWTDGELVRDITLFRLTLPTEGDVRFGVTLLKGGRPQNPDGRDTPWVELGTTSWTQGVPRIWGPWEAWVRDNRTPAPR